MLCDDCKKRQASIHIIKIINNQKLEKHLCEDCAKKTGELQLTHFAVDSGLSVQDFLKGMFTHCVAEEPQPKQEMICQRCGMTYSQFRRTSKIGCCACYNTFGRRLEPLLRHIHGASVHTGKVPKRSGVLVETRQRLKRMKTQLEQHIEREEYELAATLRDEIKAVDKEVQEQRLQLEAAEQRNTPSGLEGEG